VKSLATAVGAVHEKFIFGRRARILAEHLCRFLPLHAHVLDVGCGDGTIDALIQRQRPDVSIEGIEVLVQPSPHIMVRRFDGTTIPFQSQSFDVAMFVDVLHHAEHPLVLLGEGARVGKSVVIKDHFRDGLLAAFTLRLMDWIGNAHRGVALPYNYWSRNQWSDAFGSLGLEELELKTSLDLYPPPASWLFERGLHFMTLLRRK
jgi:SAM-dependent methyltransferase